MRRRWAPIAVALAGWVLLIVLAAGPSADDRSWLTLPDFGSLMTIFYLVAIVVGIVFLIQNLRTVRPTAGEAKVSRAAIVVGLILGLLIALANPDLQNLFQPEEEETVDLSELDGGDGGAPAAEFEVRSDHVLPVLLTVFALVALLGWSHRRTRSLEVADVAPPVEPDTLAAVLDHLAADLSTDADPRTAVMVAYARLEQTLANDGLPRRDSETAPEHLGRVRSSIPIDTGPLLRLAGLYELARYSARPISEDDRSAALADLAELRAGIGAMA